MVLDGCPRHCCSKLRGEPVPFGHWPGCRSRRCRRDRLGGSCTTWRLGRCSPLKTFPAGSDRRSCGPSRCCGTATPSKVTGRFAGRGGLHGTRVPVCWVDYLPRTSRRFSLSLPRRQVSAQPNYRRL